MRRRTRRLLVATASLYVGTWTVNRSLRRVEGGSMRPTLEEGDLVLVVPARLVGVRRGDVVVVPDPREPRRRTIKRVAAVAGGSVVAGGTGIRAGAGEVVVLGDDPTASTDSRVYGPVPVADVQAVAVLGVRPLRRLWRAPATPAPRRRSARS